MSKLLVFSWHLHWELELCRTKQPCLQPCLPVIPGLGWGDPGPVPAHTSSDEYIPAPLCPRLFHVIFRRVIPPQTPTKRTGSSALQRWSQERAGFVNTRYQFCVLPPGWSCSILPCTNTCGALPLHSAAHPSSHLRSQTRSHPARPGWISQKSRALGP